MAILADDDFQSYPLGPNPAFVSYQNASSAGSTTVVNTPAGIYGDIQTLAIEAGAVQFPQLPSITLAQALAGVTYANSGVPTYTNMTLFFGTQIAGSGGTDEQGFLLQLNNNVNPFQGSTVLRVDINTDGTVSLLSNGVRWATSDFSLLTDKWYWFQVNAAFSTSGSFIAVNVTLAVNGQTILTGSQVTTANIGSFPSLYVNNIIWGPVGGGGGYLSRTTIYDTIQSIGDVPHPGSPSAFVTQGVIELIKAPSGTLPTIPACILGSGSVGDFYDQTFSATGGVAPYTWSLASGSGPLPPGLTLNPATGEVSGTLTTAGGFSYTVQVTDSIGNTSTKDCSISVSGLSACAERFGPKLYFWEPSFLERPEDTFLRATDWEDAGYDGLKFVQGLIVEADTEGQDRNILVQGDQMDLEIVPINHNGQLMNAYSFTTPYEAHMLRVIPQDPDFWRLFNIRWVFEPAPEYVYEWKTQGTDHDMTGYQFLKDGFIAHRSTVDLTLTITVDGNDFVYTIANSGGVYRKTYILFALANSGLALKGKLFTYQLRSTNVTVPFQLYQKDSEVRVHAWSGGGYSVKLPFGDISRISGAKL